jgi:hypothetical protein
MVAFPLRQITYFSASLSSSFLHHNFPPPRFSYFEYHYRYRINHRPRQDTLHHLYPDTTVHLVNIRQSFYVSAD